MYRDSQLTNQSLTIRSSNLLNVSPSRTERHSQQRFSLRRRYICIYIYKHIYKRTRAHFSIHSRGQSKMDDNRGGGRWTKEWRESRKRNDGKRLWILGHTFYFHFHWRVHTCTLPSTSIMTVFDLIQFVETINQMVSRLWYLRKETANFVKTTCKSRGRNYKIRTIRTPLIS